MEKTASMRKKSEKDEDRSIKVFLRMRPPQGREIVEKDPCTAVTLDTPTTISVRKAEDTRTFTFHRCFPPNTSQDEVYDRVAKSAVDDALDGYHGVIFVYGQTGSGKTFTIANNEEGKLGILQRSLLELWSRMQSDKEFEYRCSVSYAQLYNELLNDLLDEDPAESRIRLNLGNERRGDVAMVNEKSGKPIDRPVYTYEESMDLFRRGTANRVTASTKMNAHSSRSHTVFQFHIYKSRKGAASQGLGDAASPTALEGRLILCDLAGSERIKKTEASGVRLEEATHINGSLLVLGKVVNALTDKAKHQFAPFRESKLTRLLQYSLCGFGRTSIVINVSPSDYNVDETLSSIAFGQRAIQIKQTSQRHEVLDYKAMYLALQAQMDGKMDTTIMAAIDEERRAYGIEIDNLKDRIKALEDENSLLIQQLQMRGGPTRSSISSVASGVSPTPYRADPNFDGGAMASARGEEQWYSITSKLRQVIIDRDAKINELVHERADLSREMLSWKDKCLALGVRLQSSQMRLVRDNAELAKRNDELSGEVAMLKGTDYLCVTGPASDTDSQGTPRMPVESPMEDKEVLTPTTGANGSPLDVADQLLKAQMALSALRQERIEMIMYQSTAAKAIRVLYAEREVLKHRILEIQSKT